MKFYAERDTEEAAYSEIQETGYGEFLSAAQERADLSAGISNHEVLQTGTY